jgi:hypothetical protein
MVFPQGKFSTDAMAALKAHNFDGAVNTVPRPVEQAVRLNLAELAQPAVLRYGGFPLFLREDSIHTQLPDIAFKLFFGRPVFIVEHHQIFQEPEPLIAAVSRINACAPQVQWSSPARAASNAVLWRRASDGTYDIRAYSRTVRLANDSGSAARFRIKWTGYDAGTPTPRQVLLDGTPCSEVETVDHEFGIAVDLQAGASHIFTLIHENSHEIMDGLGLRRTIGGFVRRRLSELRDNHLSKNPGLLRAAETLRKHLQRWIPNSQDL